MKNYITMYEDIIINAINLDDRGFDKNATLLEKLREIHNIFQKEFACHYGEVISEPHLFADWLEGEQYVMDISNRTKRNDLVKLGYAFFVLKDNL